MVKKVTTPVFRVSFPQIVEAHAMQEGQKPKFSICAVFEPGKFSEAEKAKWAAMLALADEVSLERHKKPVDKLPANFKKPIRDGLEKEDLEGFGEGKVFTNLSSLMRPGVIDRDRNQLTVEEIREQLYPGVYARATITAYAYDQGGGKGVAFGLQNIQIVKDGDRLDSRTNAEDDFDDDLRDEEDPLA